MMFLLSFAFFLRTLTALTNPLSCKNEVGDSVLSWEILKFPHSTSYVYSTDIAASIYDLNDTTVGALAWTMQQFWLPNVQYALYNDEPPHYTLYNFSVAHAKASIVWDSTSAVALFHSIPQFPVGPASSSHYTGLLQNAWEYAQHIVCITLETQDFLKIGGILAGMNPQVYDGSLPLPITSAYCQYQPFGKYILIAKPASYEVDIWESCVGSYTSTEVISWVHGVVDGPYCNTTTTLDILSIEYPFGVSYSNYENHAKWGVGTYPVVCFGDLNRVETQKVRSGAVVCWKDAELFVSLKGIVGNTNSCE